MTLLALLAATALATTAPAPAPAPDGRPQQPPGATLPLAPARTLSIHAHSGTWMSLDVTADGRTILFDMLGDLYAMPVRGGPARQLTTGLGYDTQATVSPDGKSIVFVSDRSGADNLWIAKPDGSGAHQISFGDDDTPLASPAWSADGRAVFVSRFRPDLNNYELWRYGVAGGGELLSPVRAAPDTPDEQWHSALGAVASHDGKWLYYARRIGGLDSDRVDAWTIVRRDLATGAETVIVEGSGSRGTEHDTVFRPALSPDDRLLAYATHVAGRTELRLRDLATGRDRLLLSPLDRDQIEAAAWQDIIPRYAFTPDGKALLIARAGAFDRVALADGAVTRLPLDAEMRVAVGPSTRADTAEDDGPVRARLAMAPIASPDGNRIAFSALGGLYVAPAAGGDPVRLATPAPAWQPAWSPDGRRLVFVTWDETAGGALWTIPADGSAAATRASDLPAYYTYPVFTPDGAGIVAVRSAQAARQETSFEFGKLRAADLVLLPATGGAARVLTHGTIGSRPHFAGLPGTVAIQSDDGLDAIDLASGTRDRIAQVKGPGWYFQDGSQPVDDMRLSPDGKWIAAEVAQQLFLVAAPAKGATVDLTDPALAKHRITAGGVDYFEWNGQGGIDWSAGTSFHRTPLADLLPLAPGTPTLPKVAPGVSLAVTVPRALPTGSILLRGARVLTMAQGDRVLNDADILVTGNRIAAIGPRGTIPVPAGTTVRDVSGKTIVPGFIDEHDHIGSIRRDVLSSEDWSLRARLAYGVTTSFDPSTLSIDMLAYQDMIDAGQVLGPRLRSTGMAIFSFNRFASLDEVRAVIGRYKADYRLGNIKEYRTGNRRVRQWMAMATREQGVRPTTEGALSLKLDLSQMIDGFAGNEHTLVATPLGDDVIGLLKAMRTSYATTLMITNGGPLATDWFVETHDPLTDARTRHFWPPAVIEQKLVARPWRPLRDYRFPATAADAARVAAAGGLVGMGAHGEVPGLGFHWEMEAHAMGGMAPMAILHAATAGSAETIGRLRDLGTIEPGKLADLVILDRDPLADIRNTTSVSAVMRGGFLYASDTLDELWPEAKPLAAPWFAAGAAAQYLPATGD